MNETIQFFTPSRGFASALGLMARQAFSEAFAHLYDPVQFAQFLEEAFGPSGKMEQISRILPFAGELRQSADSPIGYAKLSPLVAPAPAPQPGVMELRQIYVLRLWHGGGVADELMNWAIDTARTEGAPEIYLAVFDQNIRAKRFYARHGFAEVGRCTFKLGDRVDDDRVWRKPLSVASEVDRWESGARYRE